MKTRISMFPTATFALGAMFAASQPLAAASLVWDANAATIGQIDGSGGWLDGNQWRIGTTNMSWSNAVPDDAIIGSGGTGGTITTGAATTGGLSIDPFSGTYVFGSGALTINAGGITKSAGSGGVSVVSTIVLGAPQSWINNSSTLLTANSQVTTGGNALTIAGTGTTTLAGSNMLTGSGPLIKNDGGVLNLAGSITSTSFTGGVTLNAGTLNLSGQGGVSVAGATTVLGSGTVTLNGGTLDNTSGVDLTVGHNNAQTWGGNINFAGSRSLNLGTGPVTLTADRTVTVNANNLTVGGIIGGAGFGFAKAGNGTLTVSGNSTFTGTVSLNTGTLRATSSGNALGTGAATLNLSGGELQLANGGNSNLTFARNTTVTGNSTITADTTVVFGGSDGRENTYTLGTLSIGGQTLAIAGGAGVISPLNTGANGGIAFGATNLTGSPVFNLINPTAASAYNGLGGRTLATVLTLGAVADNGNTATLTGSGNLAQTAVWGGGAGGLTLNSAYSGVATLSQANTFTGAVTINGGTLVANTLANGGLASNLGASTSAAGNLVLGGGTLQTSSALAIDRNFTLSNGTTSTLNNSGALVITGGSAASTGSLIKIGAGTLTLAGTNLHTGSTSVNAGNLTLGFSNAIAPVTNILSPGSSLVMGGGTLTLTGKASTANSQTFTGTTVNRGASNINAANGTSGTMDAALGPIVRTPGQNGTANFSKALAGNLTTTTPNDATGILGAWATFGATDYARNDGSGNIVALGMIDSLESAWTSSTGNFTMAGSTVLTGSRTINTLRNTVSGSNLSLGGDGTAFDLTSTGLLNGGGGIFTVLRTGTASGVVRIAAASEFFAGGTVNIDAPLSVGSGAIITKSNAAQFQIRGGLITLGDATLINNTGNFNVTTGGSPATSVATLGGNLTLLGSAVIGFNAMGFDLNNGNRTIFANGTAAQSLGGTINNTGGSAGQNLTIGGSGAVTVTGFVSGINTPGLEINGTGVYTFGTANTFAGGVTLTSGTVRLNDATGLGTGTFSIRGGTITQSNVNITYANPLIIDGVNNTPVNFPTSLEGFARNMTFSGISTVLGSPTLNFTNGFANGGSSSRDFTGMMTLNSNLTLTGTHTGNVVIGGGLTFGANRTIQLNDTGRTTIRGPLVGGTNQLTLAGGNQRVFFGTGGTVTGTTGGVVVSGGVVTFGNSDSSTPNTFTGGVTLTGGTLVFNGNTAGAVTSGPVGIGTLSLLGGAVGNNVNTGSSTIANTLVLDGANSTPIQFISGTDGFFRAANFSGATTVQNSPTLHFTHAPGDGSNNGSRTFSGAKTLGSNLTFIGTHAASVLFTNGFDLGGANRVITFNDEGVTSLAGDLSGPPSILTLAGSNTKSVISGLTGATAHALTINGTANSLFTMSAASTYTGTTTVNGGTLAYSVQNAISTGDVTVSGATAVLNLGTNRSDSVGTVTVDGGGKITGNGSSTLISTGSFELKNGSVSVSLDGAGTILNKTTGGTVTLYGASTYSGITTVSEGTLEVNNATGSGTGSAAVNVASGAALGGTGSIAAAATLDSGANLGFILRSSAGNHDSLELGSLTFSGTSTVVISSAGGAFPGDYTLATSSTPITGAPSFTPSLPAGWSGTVSVVGNDLILNLTSTGGSVSAYDAWAAGFPGFTNTAPGADFDNDGLKNLMEFVLGGDPTISQPGVGPTVTASGTNLVITFKRSDASELQPVAVKVQVSNDLVTWNPASDIPISPGNASNPGPIGASGASYTITNSSGFDTVTVTIPKGAATSKFARVVATE